MPPPVPWEREVCQALNINTEQELDAHLKKRGGEQEILKLAVRFGWVREPIHNGWYVASYPPGSFRPRSLGLPVYDGDSLQGEKAFLKQASLPAPRGIRFERSGLFRFVEARLRRKEAHRHACMPRAPLDHTRPYTTPFTPTIIAAFLDGSRVNADPAPSASSIVVMAKDPYGIWWPARLVPRDEYEYWIKHYGTKEQKAAARRLRSHGVRLRGCCGNGDVAPPVSVCSEPSDGHTFCLSRRSRRKRW